MDSGAPPAAPASWRIVTEEAAATKAVAEALGRVCRGGEVIGLVGTLGVGKTCFVQGLAAGLGVPATAYVNSPTFALVNHHPGERLVLHHVDLYRLDDPDEAVFIGYEDLFEPQSVVAIEWFEQFPELWPRAYLRVDLKEEAGASVCPPGQWAVEQGRRQVEVRTVGEPYEELLRRWQQGWSTNRAR